MFVCNKQELGSLVMWVVGAGWSWGVSAFQRRLSRRFHTVNTIVCKHDMNQINRYQYLMPIG